MQKLKSLLERTDWPWVVIVIIPFCAFYTSMGLQDRLSALFTQPTWYGELYENKSAMGPPKVALNVPKLKIFWESKAPEGLANSDDFSAHFWTCLKIKSNDSKVVILYGADDGLRMLIDGKIHIDATDPSGYATQRKEVTLNEGNHLVQVDYFESWGNAGIYAEFGLLKNDQYSMPIATTLPTFDENNLPGCIKNDTQ